VTNKLALVKKTKRTRGREKRGGNEKEERK